MSEKTSGLLLRRGPTEDRRDFVPLKGEIIFDTDNNNVYVGDSQTYGGVSVFNDKIRLSDQDDFTRLEKDAIFDITGSIIVPRGSTLERPPTETTEQKTYSKGAIRYNTSLNSFEGFNGDDWGGLAGAGGFDVVQATSIAENVSERVISEAALPFDAFKVWQFQENLEGWQGVSCVLDIDTPGIMSADASGNDPEFGYVFTDDDRPDPSIYKDIHIRVRRLSGSGWAGRLRFFVGGTAYDTVIDDPGTDSGNYITIKYNLSTNTNWAGTITSIFFQLGETIDDDFLVDWIAIGNQAPAGYFAAVSEEAATRVEREGLISSQYALKVDAGGYVAGYGLISTFDPVKQAGDSEFVITADTFRIVTPGGNAGDEIQPFIVSTADGQSVVTVNGQLRVGNSTLASVTEEVTANPNEIGSFSTDPPAGNFNVGDVYFNTTNFNSYIVGLDNTGTKVWKLYQLRAPREFAGTTAGTTWSDADANASLPPTLPKIIGDRVTLSNTTPGSEFAETRSWDGDNWIPFTLLIDGNALIDGTVTANKVAANSIDASKILVDQTLVNELVAIGDFVTIDSILNDPDVQAVLSGPPEVGINLIPSSQIFTDNQRTADAQPALGTTITLTYGLDDVRQKVDIVQPTAGTSIKGVVLWIHGGGWSSGERDDIYAQNKKDALVAQGYLAVVPSYRLAPTYTFPAIISDITTLLDLLLNDSATPVANTTEWAAVRQLVEQTGLVVSGESAGGHLSIMGTFEYAYTNGLWPDAVFNIVGPMDLISDGPSDPDNPIGSAAQDLLADASGGNSQLIEDASPLAQLTKWRTIPTYTTNNTKFFFYGNTTDTIVPPTAITPFVDELQGDYGPGRVYYELDTQDPPQPGTTGFPTNTLADHNVDTLTVLRDKLIENARVGFRITPIAITIQAGLASSLQNEPVTFSVQPVVELEGTGNSRTLTAMEFGQNNTIEISASVSADTSTFTDTVTIARLQSGTGTPGTDAFSVILTNDSHTLAADQNGTPLTYSGATATVLVFLGATDVSTDPGLTFTKVDSSGVTSSITDNVVSITNMTSGTNSGFVDITVENTTGLSVTKRFTVSKVENGAPGTPGAQGADGDRAPGQFFADVSVSPSSDSQWNSAANQALSDLGYPFPVVTDVVTLRNLNDDPVFIEQRSYDGSNWIPFELFINGNAIVQGTLAADKLAAGEASFSATGAKAGFGNPASQFIGPYGSAFAFTLEPDGATALSSVLNIGRRAESDIGGLFALGVGAVGSDAAAVFANNISDGNFDATPVDVGGDRRTNVTIAGPALGIGCGIGAGPNYGAASASLAVYDASAGQSFAGNFVGDVRIYGNVEVVNGTVTATQFTQAGSATFASLTDTPSNYIGQNGRILVVDESNGQIIFGDPSLVAGASTLIELTDTPGNYGTTGQILQSTGSAVTWANAPAGAFSSLSDVPAIPPTGGYVFGSADGTLVFSEYKLVNLLDTPADYGTAGQILVSTGSGYQFANQSVGVTSFVELSDTPSTIPTALAFVSAENGTIVYKDFNTFASMGAVAGTLAQRDASAALFANDFIIPSDRTLKKNIRGLDKDLAIDALGNIAPVTFNYVEGTDKRQKVGFIAQDVEEYFPQFVTTSEEGKKQLSYSMMTAVLWKQNQELLKRIEKLEQQLGGK